MIPRDCAGGRLAQSKKEWVDRQWRKRHGPAHCRRDRLQQGEAQQPETPQSIRAQKRLVGFAQPEREPQAKRTAEQGDAECDNECAPERLGGDTAEEYEELHHRQSAGDQPHDGNQPRGQLAQHNLEIGQVGHEHVRHRTPGLVEADRPGRRRRRCQEHERQLRADHSLEEPLAELGHQADVALGRVRARVHPDIGQGHQQEQDERRPQRIALPAPRGPDPLIGENRTQTQPSADAPAHELPFFRGLLVATG